MVWTSGWNEKGIGYASSKDLENWTDISDKISFTGGVRHGTAFRVSGKRAIELIEKYK
jgi:hypothetical protein